MVSSTNGSGHWADGGRLSQLWAEGFCPGDLDEAPPAARPRCWAYSAAHGWGEAHDPTAALEQEGDSPEDRLGKAGFYKASTFGVEHSRLTLDVYRNARSGQYLAQVWLADTSSDLLLWDEPSALEFLARVLPMVHASAALELIEEAARRPRRK
jgi:hypothetical protein